MERAVSTDLVTGLTWDLLGRLTNITDPTGNAWTYVYDSLGRRTSASDPDMGTWTYQYDNAGRMTFRTDALGQVTAFTYDLLDRVLTETARDGTLNEELVTNTYDEVRSGFYNKGKLTTAANDNATITYDQDAAGRLACPWEDWAG